ncbi:MAG: flagellar type III secretion system pore protein FliP [Verrucomicrobia bacterium]|nr:flagellar type III secretion system pore protein FliP [Verrucomicrobiota bacterium]
MQPELRNTRAHSSFDWRRADRNSAATNRRFVGKGRALLGLLLVAGIFFAVLFCGATSVFGQATPGGAVASRTNAASGYNLNFGFNLPNQPRDVDMAIRILFILTLLTLAPSLVMLMTSFTRIVIVFSFLRTALSLQGTPSSQLLIGFSLFLTFFIMAPTYQRINQEALQPYSAGQITSQEAVQRASVHMRNFMLQQARQKDVEVFVSLAKLGPTTPEQLPMHVIIPGFVLSELRTGFQMGFLLFIPFILIDFVVAIVLMSLGLMMLPPAFISLPLKLLLFVLVDGWTLLVRSLADSFRV